jgi:hypothetical protein
MSDNKKTGIFDIVKTSKSKGRIVVYDAKLRQIIENNQIDFEFVPNDVVVKYNPNYEFLSAPQGLKNFVQFGSSKPRTISFTLFFAGLVSNKDDIELVKQNMNKLKRLVTPSIASNTRLAPPLVRLEMGNIVEDHTGLFPIGVISSLGFKGESYDADLQVNRIEVDIEFTESTTDYGVQFGVEQAIQRILTQQGNQR